MRYADRTNFMKASEIRELLKITENPEIISFAGGMPSPHSFPVAGIKRIMRDVLEKHGSQALEYGPTEGLRSLREALIERMGRTSGIKCGLDHILITTGSQQVLDLMPKVLINPGDSIIVECPTYVGALTAFNAYQPNYIAVSMDHEGMKTDELEKKIRANRDKNIKFIYTIPTFQNPSGITMSFERRKHLMELAGEYNIPVLEDDAYFSLRYSGKELPSVKSIDDKELVVYARTFSKTFAPGLRLGWVVGKAEMIRKMTIAKQGVDLCTNMLVQYMAEEYLSSGLIDRQIPKIIRMYRRKRDIMLEALERHFPEGSSWTRPDGGMFLWVVLPERIDTKKMLQKALEAKVAYVDGTAFTPDGSGRNAMRLNFSNTDDDRIEEGVIRLAKIIKERQGQA
jgi:2-aminoadipate transaminase